MRFLIRDSDDKLIVANEVLRSEGTETLRNPVRAPRANVFAVGWIGTMRAECLDELLNFSHRQINHVLRTYVEHCDTVRPHRGIGLETPRATVSGDPDRKIERRGVLGGPVHECRRGASGTLNRIGI